MEHVILISVAGLISALLVAGTLALTHSLKLIDDNPLVIIGYAVMPSKSRETATLVGITLHILVGISFAYLYYSLWNFVSPGNAVGTLFFFASIGFLHGFVVSFSLIVALAEFHPRPEYRRVGFPAALVYIVGHILYGMCLGVCLLLFKIV